MKTGLQLANVVHGTSLFIKAFFTKHDIRASKFLTSGLYLPSLSIYSPPPPSPSSPVYPPLLPSNLMTSLLFISTINFQYQFTLHFHHHRFHQFIQLRLHYRKLRFEQFSKFTAPFYGTSFSLRSFFSPCSFF